MGPRYFPAFKEHGHFEWKVKVAGQMVAVKVRLTQAPDGASLTWEKEKANGVILLSCLLHD